MYNLPMTKELKQIEMLKLRVGDLLAQRQIISQALIVLIGGVVGICFMQNTILKYVFIISGVLYIIVLAKNLYYAQTILKDIYKKNGEDGLL